MNVDPDWKFHTLAGRVFEELDVKPDKVDDNNPIAGSLKKIYGSLKGIVAPIAEIRNEYGTGHGRTADFEGIDSRHAKLLVGMCVTLVLFLWETHEETLKNAAERTVDSGAANFKIASEEAVRDIVRKYHG